MQQGFAHCWMQETQQAGQQAPALYRPQNAQPNHHHHHCTMISEPVVFSEAAYVRDYRYRCMNDVATAHSLQEWSALLCYVCYMGLGRKSRVITPVQGVVCLSYVSWHSIQRHNPVQVVYSNTVYRLQIQV
jgi:hypothetical protein